MESEVESGVESEAMGPEDASTCTYVLNVDDSEGTTTASLEDNGEELAVPPMLQAKLFSNLVDDIHMMEHPHKRDLPRCDSRQ